MVISNWLLETSIQIDAYDSQGRTALYHACQDGQLDIVKLLLAKGANVNRMRDVDGITPLAIAANNGFNTVVEALCEHGVNVEARSLTSWTPLMVAASGGHCEVLETLLQYDARVNAETELGTALLRAVVSGHEAAVQLLVSH